MVEIVSHESFDRMAAIPIVEEILRHLPDRFIFKYLLASAGQEMQFAAHPEIEDIGLSQADDPLGRNNALRAESLESDAAIANVFHPENALNIPKSPDPILEMRLQEIDGPPLGIQRSLDLLNLAGRKL